MAQCHNCGEEIQGGMKFCPHCGQDQTVVVPREERIPTEPVEGVPEPPPSSDFSPAWNTTGSPSAGPASSGMSKKWLVGLLGCGGVGLLLLALVVVAIVSGSSSNTAQSGGGQESGDAEKKSTSKSSKSGSDNPTAAVGESVELDDRTFSVAEVERNYTPNNQFSKAERGNEYLRVLITLTNTSNGSISYNPFDFKVQDSNGVQKSQTFIPEVPNDLESGNLAPNGKIQGNLVFEVPRNDNGLKLLYTTNMFSGETVTVEPLQ